LAEGGQVLVSRTVRDLVAGSHLVFEEQGTHTLKGLGEPMPLFTAMNERGT
jgi:class 3 adenylate cyclase